MPKSEGFKNLKFPKNTEEAREWGKKGGINSGKVRKEKKMVADLLNKWADSKLSKEDEEKIRELGLSGETTNRALFLLPLIQNLKNADLSALKLAIKILGEDRKEEAEINLLEAETKQAEKENSGNANELPTIEFVFTDTTTKKNEDNNT